MTNDEQKIEQLSSLLDRVIFALEMTQYDIDSFDRGAAVVQQADAYHQQMMDILHG